MRRILLIEDDEAIRVSTADLLTYCGFEVTAAEDGPTGLEAASKELPDIVLCDLRMPKVDGFGVLKALRENPKTQNLPVIFISALAAGQDVENGLKAGAAGYLVKPFSKQQLLQCIATVLK